MNLVFNFYWIDCPISTELNIEFLLIVRSLKEETVNPRKYFVNISCLQDFQDQTSFHNMSKITDKFKWWVKLILLEGILDAVREVS